MKKERMEMEMKELLKASLRDTRNERTNRSLKESRDG
jgi:hypothetical protein